jgi:hypothetical protein
LLLVVINGNHPGAGSRPTAAPVADPHVSVPGPQAAPLPIRANSAVARTLLPPLCKTFDLSYRNPSPLTPLPALDQECVSKKTTNSDATRAPAKERDHLTPSKAAPLQELNAGLLLVMSARPRYPDQICQKYLKRMLGPSSRSSRLLDLRVFKEKRGQSVGVGPLTQSPNSITASISTLAPLGRAATPIAALAG